MKCQEFNEREKFKVINTLRELMGSLGSSSANISYPSFAYKETMDLALELKREGFVSAGKNIQHFYEQDSQWKIETLVSLPKRDYSSLVTFKIDGVKYLAAGYKTEGKQGSYWSGIEIANLAVPENKSVQLELDGESNRGVNSLGIAGIAPREIPLSGSLLVAAHSDLGVIGIPLEELVAKRFLKISQVERQNYSLLGRTGINGEHWEVKVGKNKIYATNGKEVYDVHVHPANKKGRTKKALKKVLTPPLSGGDTVTALELDEKGNLYAAATGGTIFKNNSCFYRFSDLPIITKMQAGNHNGKEGLFFHGIIEDKHSLVYFSDGESNTIVSPIDKVVIDFGYGNERGFFLTKKGIIIGNTTNQVELELLNEGSKKNQPKKLYVCGGI